MHKIKYLQRIYQYQMASRRMSRKSHSRKSSRKTARKSRSRSRKGAKSGYSKYVKEFSKTHNNPKTLMKAAGANWRRMSAGEKAKYLR